METNKNERKKPGRKVALDPAIYKYSIKLNSVDNDLFLRLLRKSGQESKTEFIKSMLFDKPLKVVFVDKVAKDYYMRLTTIYEQYRSVGVNYNQTVKAIKTNFAEKRALAMLYRLEKATIQLIAITKEVIHLTKEYENKWLQK